MAAIKQETTGRYGPEAEALRQELAEIEVRRRVREAVTAQLAALAVPGGAAAKRKSLSAKTPPTAGENMEEKATANRKVSGHANKKEPVIQEPAEKGRLGNERRPMY